MNLKVNISPATAAWLGRKAQESGTDEAVVAAGVLDALAGDDNRRNGRGATDRVVAFDRWITSLPARPGPAVDASRDGIYD